MVQMEHKMLLTLQGRKIALLDNFKFSFVNIKDVLISGITGKGLEIDLDTNNDRPQLHKLSYVTIRDCIFTESRITLKTVMLHIRDCKFINNSQKIALKLYSSYVTFYGMVSFLSNTASLGGALSLIESIIYMEENCSVNFINNHAEDVGGAIFIDSNDDCFYVVTWNNYYTRSCRIHFNNNTARNGGDHIYGTSFMGKCQSKSVVMTVRYATEADWNNFFTFEHPHFSNDSMTPLSVVSSTPSRVCLCNNQGQPMCADIDGIFVVAESYPGEVITIPAVLVGGDFGTTIGSVHSYFINEKAGHTQLLVTNNPEVQHVKQNRECTSLKYRNVVSGYSSYQLLYLAVTVS